MQLLRVEQRGIYKSKNSSHRPHTIPIYQTTRHHVPVVAFTAVRNLRFHVRPHQCKNLAYLNHVALKKIVFTIRELTQVTGWNLHL